MKNAIRICYPLIYASCIFVKSVMYLLGMVWCISLSNYEVDVDLLFQENSSIGVKISITEKIVYLLPIMHCPHRLEPHQIQGLDCIHIFPVVQWLVRKAIETRNELGNTIRTFSVFNFCKEFSLVSDATSIDANRIVESLSSFESQVRPRRKFRNSNSSLRHDRDNTKVCNLSLSHDVYSILIYPNPIIKCLICIFLALRILRKFCNHSGL